MSYTDFDFFGGKSLLQVREVLPIEHEYMSTCSAKFSFCYGDFVLSHIPRGTVNGPLQSLFDCLNLKRAAS